MGICGIIGKLRPSGVRPVTLGHKNDLLMLKKEEIKEFKNRERPVRRTLFGVLLRDTNWKCLILTVLIQSCLVAIVWCRNTQVTKILLDFNEFPITSTRQVSPCDDGYVYIPTAFVIMLYLLYLVECWHSKARVQLSLEKTDVNSVYRQIRDMRETQPLVWWKAICYHYVRRFRQVTRYRNGEAYTSSQVFYERVNSNAVASCFFYALCGMKDVSKNLVELEKHPATRIKFAKSFVFSNTVTATEFEEQRSVFFQEQRTLDDYMEMREGLELTSVQFKENVIAWSHPECLPWFARNNVFWVFSFLLLSWPIRILLELNTAHLQYTVTKLFGVNYPSNLNLHELQRPLLYSSYLHLSQESRRGSRFPRRTGNRPNRLSNINRSYDISTASETLLPQETAFYNREGSTYNFTTNGMVVLTRATSTTTNDDEDIEEDIESNSHLHHHHHRYSYRNRSKLYDFHSNSNGSYSPAAPTPALTLFPMTTSTSPRNLPRSVTLMMEPEAFNVSFGKGLFTKRNFSFYSNSTITDEDDAEADGLIPTYAEALLLMAPNSNDPTYNIIRQNQNDLEVQNTPLTHGHQTQNTSICENGNRNLSSLIGESSSSSSNTQRESRRLMSADSNESGFENTAASLVGFEIDMTHTVVSSMPVDPLREETVALNQESPPTYIEALRTSRPVFLPAFTRIRRCLTERDIAGGIRSRDMERERLRSWLNYVSPTFLQRFRRRPLSTMSQNNIYSQAGYYNRSTSRNEATVVENEKGCEESNI